MVRSLNFSIVVLVILLLSACSSSIRVGRNNVISSPDIKVSAIPSYKIGNSYSIRGITYYPKEDFQYDETGIASWYGAKFHGRDTANGETYNRWAMTAAHKTLPLPTIVEVLNLRNGRKIIVRINDRGPFVDNRIIDLSERAAETLGFARQGTTPVRVRVLRMETKKLIANLSDQKKKASLYARDENLLNDQQRSISIQPINDLAGSLIPSARAATIANSGVLPLLSKKRSEERKAKSKSASKTQTFKSQNFSKLKPNSKELASIKLATGHYLQIGAFKNSYNARRTATLANEMGYQVRVLPLHKNSYILYRVQIGPYKSVKNKDLLKAKKKLGAVGLKTLIFTIE